MEATKERPVHEPPPAARLLWIITGKATTRLLFVAASLGIADLLAGGARSVDDLSAATGAHAPALCRVLNI